MPATSNLGVNCPQACRFQGLLDQSEKTSAGLAAGAGIAKRLGEAGAILKSPAGTAFADSAVLSPVALPASFCCAQRGSAKRAPIATIAYHLRIVSSILVTRNPVSYWRHPFIEFSLNGRWRRRTIRSKPLASPKWGRFYPNLANNGSSCEMKPVAAAGSIFYNFIILQAFPKIKRKPQRFGVPGSWPDAARPELHFNSLWLPQPCLT